MACFLVRSVHDFSMRTGVAFVLTGLFIALTVSAWHSGVAYVNHYQGRTMIDQWSRYIDFPNIEDVDAAESRLVRASRGEPENASYKNELGTIYFHRARMAKDDAIQRKYVTRAAEYFREATRLRPVWSTAWANLMSMESAAGRYNGDVEKAIGMTIKTGPFEQGVEDQLFITVIMFWQEVPDEYRSWLLNHMSRFISKANRTMLIDLGRQQEVCAKLPAELERKDWFCRQ